MRYRAESGLAGSAGWPCPSQLKTKQSESQRTRLSCTLGERGALVAVEARALFANDAAVLGRAGASHVLVGVLDLASQTTALGRLLLLGIVLACKPTSKQTIKIKHKQHIENSS